MDRDVDAAQPAPLQPPLRINVQPPQKTLPRSSRGRTWTRRKRCVQSWCCGPPDRAPPLTPRPTHTRLHQAKKKKTSKPKKGKAAVVEERDPADEARYVGCYASEVSFGDRVYEGGTTGANYGLALHHAKTTGKRYFALAKVRAHTLTG